MSQIRHMKSQERTNPGLLGLADLSCPASQRGPGQIVVPRHVQRVAQMAWQDGHVQLTHRLVSKHGTPQEPI